MALKNKKIESEERLTKELTSLARQIRRMKNLEFIRVFKEPKRFFAFSFLHGVIVGFGSVIGATLGVAIFIYLLTQISLVPIIGSYVEKVLEEINYEVFTSPSPELDEEEYLRLKEKVKELEEKVVTPVSAVVPEALNYAE